jgi:hypothetical protein
MDDEVFLTNACDENFHNIGWNTKRQGQLAYDPKGEPLGIRWKGAFPVFVKKSEIEARDPRILQGILNQK